MAAHSGLPIPGASVSVNGGQTTTTDGNGYFILQNVPDGQRTLSASAPDYVPFSRTVNVPAGGTVVADLSLSPGWPLLCRMNSFMRFSTGRGPRSVVIVDFNRDGNPDIASSNQTDDNISVYLSRGDGTYQGPAVFAAGDGPYWIASGDLDGDGNPDLVTANNSSDDVTVLLGNGDGTFQTHQHYAAEDQPRCVAVGDLDRDGNQDLVTANYGTGAADSVSVLFGKGDGTFYHKNYAGPPPNRYAVYALYSKADPEGVIIGDFNGDSYPDLATANYDSDAIVVGKDVSVLLSQGATNPGIYNPPVHYPATNPSKNGIHTRGITCGDFDLDGDTDIAVTNYAVSSPVANQDVAVLINTGGTFSAQNFADAPSGCRGIESSDLNKDSYPDLIVANSSSNEVFIFLNDRTGTFSDRTDYDGGDPYFAATGDLDGDGSPDLAMANYSTDDIRALWGKGDGTFHVRSDYDVGGDPRAIAGGDFDLDGNLDLAVANYADDNVSIMRNGGGGSFSQVATPAAGNGPRGICAIDFDGDGDQDLVVANWGNNGEGNTITLLGNNAGSFTQTGSATTGNGPIFITSGDFDRDGDMDLAVANYGDQTGNGNTVSILKNTGGSFTPSGTLAVGAGPSCVSCGHFDADENPDLVVSNENGNSVTLLRGNGDCTFTSLGNFPVGNQPRYLSTGDFNRDGYLDASTANFCAGGDGTVSVLLGNGAGSLAPDVAYLSGKGPSAIASVDLNFDNKPDLIVADSSDGTVSVLLGLGDGSFHSRVAYGVSASPQSLISGFLNIGNIPDLAVPGSTAKKLSILLNISH